MSRRLIVLVPCVGFLLLLTAEGALARGHQRATCRPATCAPVTCAPATCQPKVQYVTKVVMCPVYVTRYRKVRTVECRPETRQRIVTEYRRVCETRMVERTCTMMVPQQRTKTVQCMVNVPVWKNVTQKYTVMVPHAEKRQGTRKVCKMVPVTRKRTVTEDQGHWEERPCPAPKTCAPATCAPKTCKVWVPKCVEKEIEFTCMKPIVTEEPCEYTVTVCKAETRTRTVRVCECKQQVRTRKVCYTVCVPKQVVRRCPVTTVRCVPVKRVVCCTVMVPHTVTRRVPVCCVKMVPKRVRVPVCCPPPTARLRYGRPC